MKYDILSIEFVKDKTYDIKYRSKPWFRKPVELTERFTWGHVLAHRVRDDKTFHNLQEVIGAYDIDECEFIDFEEKGIPLLQVTTI